MGHLDQKTVCYSIELEWFGEIWLNGQVYKTLVWIAIWNQSLLSQGLPKARKKAWLLVNQKISPIRSGPPSAASCPVLSGFLTVSKRCRSRSGAIAKFLLSKFAYPVRSTCSSRRFSAKGLVNAANFDSAENLSCSSYLIRHLTRNCLTRLTRP